MYTHRLYTHGVYAFCAQAWNVGEKPWYDKSDITGSVMQKWLEMNSNNLPGVEQGARIK